MTDRVAFVCNGAEVDVEVEPGESLLSVLRERLGLVGRRTAARRRASAGAAPCSSTATPRVACVTPAARVAGRSVTTIEGLDRRVPSSRPRSWRPAGRSAASARRASSCAPPGTRGDLDKALAAHLCRCTGWQTVYEAIEDRAAGRGATSRRRRRARCWKAWSAARRRIRAARRRRLRRRHRATRRARRGAAAARAMRVRSSRPAAVGVDEPSTRARREGAGPAHDDRRRDRRSRCCRCPKAACGSRRRGSSPRTSNPTRRGACPAASPRRRSRTAARSAARSAHPLRPRRASSPTSTDEPVRVVFAREDVVRLGPKRPPISATAVVRDGVVEIEGVVARGGTTNVWPTVDGVRGAARRGPRSTSRARRSAPSCAPRAWPNRPCSSRARSGRDVAGA